MANSPRKQNQQMRMTLLFAGIFMLFLLFHIMAGQPDETQQVKFHEFLAAVDLPESNPDKVVSVTFKENDITGVRKDGSAFKTFGPNDEEIRKTLLSKGVMVDYEPPEKASWWKEMLMHSVPILIFLFIFIFFMRQLQIGGGKAMSFGKSRAKLLNENETKVTFKDVAGIEEAKEELEEIIEFLRDPKKFTILGGRIPKGVLLIGPPGTGKTILAKAVAGEAGVPFFSISGSDFVEMFVGVGASRVRDLFEQAKKNAPCIIFIDEIDAVGRHRGAGMGGGHDEREQTLNQLLVEMDGFNSNEGVILVAATNRVDVLDPALLRPGRFDRRVIVGTPDLKGREEILKVHTKKSPLADNVELRTIAQGTPGFTGADLENLVNEAALIAARADCKEINNHHFELAKDKVLMGPARKSMVFGERERKTTAYHEAGHAVVARAIPEADPVHKVTIMPRGMALGVTMLLPEEDRLSLSKKQAEATIAYAMGGRAAEELIFGHYTTGASDDIKKATSIARKMVCQWGMSDSLGPLNYGEKSSDPFLGRDFGKQAHYSEKTAEEIDNEVRRIITTQYDRATGILNEHKALLEKLSEALLIKETIDREQIDSLFSGNEIITDEDRERYKVALQKKADDLKSEQKIRDNKNVQSPKKEEPATISTPLPQGT